MVTNSVCAACHQVVYKTGASFFGVVQDYKKIGSGIFIWPDGSKYDGDYVNNLRHGKGRTSSVAIRTRLSVIGFG